MHGNFRERERESFLTMEFKLCCECACVMVILRKGGINLFYFCMNVYMIQCLSDTQM